MRIRVADNYGLAIVRDSTFSVPPLDTKSRESLTTPLKSHARDGRIFFIDGEDPIDMTIDILVDQPVPEDITELFEQIGGTFVLHAPSGKIVISGYQALASGSLNGQSEISVPCGSYALSVFSRQHFDLAKYDAKMQQIVGPANWSFRNKTDKLYFIGCLPTLATILCILVKPWRSIAIYLAAFSLLGWLPYFLARRTTTYQNAERRRDEFERSLPVYVLQLRSVEDPSSIRGGYIMTQ
jgi:hypothetical protein